MSFIKMLAYCFGGDPFNKAERLRKELEFSIELHWQDLSRIVYGTPGYYLLDNKDARAMKFVDWYLTHGNGD